MIRVNKNNKVLATPAVRYLIKRHNLNIKDIVPTGKNERILKEDVLLLISKKEGKTTIETVEQISKVILKILMSRKKKFHKLLKANQLQHLQVENHQLKKMKLILLMIH